MLNTLAAAPMKKPSIESVLAQAPWFAAMDASQHLRLQQECMVRHYGGGTVIQRKGEPSDSWLGVIDGLVKVSAEGASGKSMTFMGVPSGGWFGEGSLLKRELRRYDVVALRDSLICWVPRTTFEWMLETSIPFNRYLLMQLNERLGQFIGLVEHERLLSPDARVARCLADLLNETLYPQANPQAAKRINISQEEVGYLSGVSRQRANQALKVLEETGLVNVEYGAITVLSLEGLQRFEN
jgi:CRP/FNR family transcriptional regulator, cyclic AMP receptor protein